jgi:hypothetical protein
MDTTAAIVIGIAFVFLLSVIPIVGGFIHAHRDRVLTHTERMKALEMGRELPGHEATARLRAAFGQPAPADEGDVASLARKCWSTALWVAFWGFGASAGLGGASVSSGVALAIAVSAGAIGVTAMICGTILASTAAVNAPLNGYAKHRIHDADAIDVVSRRG